MANQASSLVDSTSYTSSQNILRLSYQRETNNRAKLAHLQAQVLVAICQE
jgi:hypothetical protein